MTNTVSPETGRRLAAAGFTQPSPAPGQWWGDDEMIVFLFRAWADGKHDFFLVAQSVADGRPIIDDYFDARDFTGLVYLPTVGDILSHPLAEGYGVSRQYDTTESGLSWVCCPTEWDTPEMVSAYHETSAAEAAALVWIELNEKK